MSDRLLVTAALPYANGPLHLGHLAGAYLPSDLYCRYQRLAGRDVVFICGSDEHGVPIMLRARSEGVDPREIVDRYDEQLREGFDRFGIAFDYYGRTTSDVHHETSQEFFRVLNDADKLTVKTEEQLFDPEANLFLADRFIQGTCPTCGYEDAYGDQCEKCGSSLSPKELINPRSTLTGAEPILKETRHWYLPLAAMQPKLEEYIASRKNWKSNVRGQVQSWFAGELADRAVTRDLPWGVPVPVKDGEGKVLYVWFDAPIGYISATKEWAQKIKGDSEAWRPYWQNDQSSVIHFIGKDNIVFHCLIFPAMMMAWNEAVGEQGPRWTLASQVPANEFLNLEGRKLSTSRGWAVWVNEALDAFQPDALRYALATMLPEQKDSDFSWNDFQARVNSELNDDIGNFVNRTLTFTSRFVEGKVPPLVDPSPMDIDVLKQLSTFPGRISEAYENFRFREAVQETVGLARLGNKYFNDTEPWHTRTSNPTAMANTLHVSLQLCASLSVFLDPIVPFAAEKLRGMLRLDGVTSSTPTGNSGHIGWEEAAKSLLPDGHEIGPSEILFTKIEDAQVEAQLRLLEERSDQAQDEASDETPYVPLGETITFDDFARLDFRIGKVTVAEQHPKADRLLRLEVDLGFETRQILAGIAEQWKPEDILGRNVVIVANLAPRTMRGLESQGMVLMAENRDGQFVPVTADTEPGSVVR